MDILWTIVTIKSKLRDALNNQGRISDQGKTPEHKVGRKGERERYKKGGGEGKEGTLYFTCFC